MTGEPVTESTGAAPPATPHAAATVADDASWIARAAAVIPGAASTGSKRPAVLYGTDEPAGPTHFVRASGCRVVTAGGRALVDFTMALGSVALGYADPEVVRAATRALADGNVAGLSHVREVELAERLCDVVPCAEQVRFLKSGAEGVAAAVRIARAATGRDGVVACGYFGWLDWCTDAPGVPAGARADVREVPFDDVAALEDAVAAFGSRLAAVVLEPVQERLPSPAWTERARQLCERAGAVLVFDEVKTGFRLRPGGYQELAGVRPHVAVFGKALANGLPLAAVVGEAAVMEAARRSWISSTLAGETVALAAAGAVLDRHSRENVCAAIARCGERQRAIAQAAIDAAAMGGRIAVAGLAPMWFLRYADADHERRAVAALVRHGVLLKRGAYNFPSPAHDDDALARLADALPAALAETAAS